MSNIQAHSKQSFVDQLHKQLSCFWTAQNYPSVINLTAKDVEIKDVNVQVRIFASDYDWQGEFVEGLRASPH